MDYFVLIILFITGLILIVKGGDFFIDAASWLAGVSGIPKFVVGATIVSFATTIPEILVSCIAAMRGKYDMAVGNAVGSIAANTGLILAISILCMPAIIKRRQIFPKGFLLAGAMVLLYFWSRTGILSGIEAYLLLGIFILSLVENVHTSKNTVGKKEPRIKFEKSDAKQKLFTFIIGGFSIFIGSEILVNTSSEFALKLGVSEGIVALTIVAFGTSLPEFVTTMTALVKKEHSLSIGNILGANIIDAALILPICSFISGGHLPVSLRTVSLDIPVCLALTAIGIIPPLFTKRFMRWQGIMMFIVYALYISRLIMIS